MANDKPMPAWSNFAVWGAVGAVGYILVAWGSTSLLLDDAGALLRVMHQSKLVAAIVGLGLMVSTGVAGFSSRRRPVNPRSLRNFVIRDMVVLGLFLLFVWGFTASAAAGVLGAMGTSERVAAVTGSVIVFFAILGTFVMATVHTSANLVDDEMTADDMRERGRMFIYSFAWMAACGLLLIVLGLAGPGGVLPAKAALAGSLVLITVLTVLGIATRRLEDELMRTLEHETGNTAFYLMLVLGGGWAVLAHLGFVAAPAPLDWLTMFTVLLFVASFIALGRRKLLKG